MSRLLSVVILAGVFVIGSGPSGARAQSQAGGLPDVSDRVRVLEGIAVTLQTAVTNLQTNVTTLQTQVTVLQTANTGLQNALNAEIAARTAAQSALKNALDQEAARRADDDALLATLLNLETKLRIDADNGLAGQVNTRGKAFATRVGETFLVNGANAKVAELPLPAGSYFVLAKAVLQNQDHDSHWNCALETGDNPPGILDLADVDTESFGLSTFAIYHGIPVLTSVVTLGAAGSVNLQCFSGKAGSILQGVEIIAISVGL